MLDGYMKLIKYTSYKSIVFIFSVAGFKLSNTCSKYQNVTDMYKSEEEKNMFII